MSIPTLLHELNIHLKGKSSGHVDTVCPQCSHTRKKKKEPCLSVDIDEGVYNCHHCGWCGRVFEKVKKEYIRPLARLELLSKEALHYFENTRKISNNTLLKFNITEAKEWMPQHQKEVTTVCFNYYRGGQLINIKYRGPQKSFKLAKDAELIFYNLDGLEGQDVAVIVEGEIDCLTMRECGIHYTVSTPNGAPPVPKNKPYQPQLEYLDNCWPYFSNIKKVIIAVDDDEPGRALKQELARRLGKEKCWEVHYPQGCKDANEVLCRYGKDAVRQMVENATEWPLEGIVPMEEMADDIASYFDDGYPPGARSQVQGMDELLTFYPGHLTMITGIPGHGKDEFTNSIMVNLSLLENWQWGVINYEETPQIHSTKLIEKFTRKAFAFRRDAAHRMSREEMERGILFVDRFFHFVNVSKVDSSIDGIIAKAEELVRRKGIRGLIINPWNYLEHKLAPGQSETNYISEVLTKLVNFLWKYGVHCFLVAHPTKIQKDKRTNRYEVPTLYSISGSSHFFNKTHNGICVYRHYDSNLTEVFVQKVKWYWLGQIGWSSYLFNTDTRQYTFNESSIVHRPNALASADSAGAAAESHSDNTTNSYQSSDEEYESF